jgi:hypothetical protein
LSGIVPLLLGLHLNSNVPLDDALLLKGKALLIGTAYIGFVFAIRPISRALRQMKNQKVAVSFIKENVIVIAYAAFIWDNGCCLSPANVERGVGCGRACAGLIPPAAAKSRAGDLLVVIC